MNREIPQTLQDLKDPALFTNKAYVAGEWISAPDGKTMSIHDPFDGALLAKVPDLGVDTLRRAIDAAHAAQKEWAKKTVKERAQILRRWYDLVIANAGISSGSLPGGGNETSDAALKVIQVNVLGTLHTILPLLPAMRARGRGQIAIMGSLAARPGLPSSPAYSASKGALDALTRQLAIDYGKKGIRTNSLNIGFVLGENIAAMGAGMSQIVDAYLEAMSGLVEGRSR